MCVCVCACPRARARVCVIFRNLAFGNFPLHNADSTDTISDNLYSQFLLHRGQLGFRTRPSAKNAFRKLSLFFLHNHSIHCAWWRLKNYPKHAALSHETPQKLQNALRNTHQSTIYVKYKIKCHHIVYPFCTLRAKNRRLTSNWSLTWSFRLSMTCNADWLDCRIRKLLDRSSDWLSAWYQWRNDQCRMSPHEF